MSTVSELQAELLAIDPPVFRIVGGAADFASIADAPHATPAAYVFVEEEVSAENETMTGPVLQRMESDIAVVIITRNLSDAKGGAAAADIETLKTTVRNKLIGFVPTATQDGTPVTHIAGALLKARGGFVWHRELFGVVSYLTENRP